MRIGSSIITTGKQNKEKEDTISARDLDKKEDDLRRYEDYFVDVYGGEVRNEHDEALRIKLLTAQYTEQHPRDDLEHRRSRAMRRACQAEQARRERERANHSGS